MKRFLIGLLLVSLSQIIVVQSAAAQTAPSGVEQIFNAFQTSVDNLITAEDQNNSDTTALRIQTFQQVIDLSVAEAKDLKVRLLTTDPSNNPAVSAWKDNMVAALNKAIDYYNQEDAILSQTINLSLDTIQNMAAAFKNWRDNNYMFIADQINSYILILGEKDAIGVAELRAQKIAGDIQKLPSAKDFNPDAMLTEAKQDIADGKTLNNQAYEDFLNEFIGASSSPDLITPNQNASSSTGSSSVDMNNLEPLTIGSDNSSSTTTNSSTTPTGTSTEIVATSTEVSPLPALSIKDLIQASLDKIKDAYQVFIEMSNKVRKLLS